MRNPIALHKSSDHQLDSQNFPHESTSSWGAKLASWINSRSKLCIGTAQWVRSSGSNCEWVSDWKEGKKEGKTENGQQALSLTMPLCCRYSPIHSLSCIVVHTLASCSYPCSWRGDNFLAALNIPLFHSTLLVAIGQSSRPEHANSIHIKCKLDLLFSAAISKCEN